jgi:hypothetical protein
MDNNGWPGEPGVPLNPERDGWHWVESAEGPVPALWARPLWRHCRDFWDQRSPEWMEEQQWRYLGPCLTPAEVESHKHAAVIAYTNLLNLPAPPNLIAQARRDALEEAARWHDEQAFWMIKGRRLAKAEEHRKHAAAIRALKGEGDE